MDQARRASQKTYKNLVWQLKSPAKLMSEDRQMDRRLLKACNEGDLELFKALALDDPSVLTSATPDGNNCLLLAVMLGFHEFAKEVWSREPSLLLSTNKEGETPLIAALAAANADLASDIIAAAAQHLQPDMEGGKPLNELLLKFDRHGENVLHHAMRNNFEDLAIQLLDREPQLSEQVNKSAESPMFMAARRGHSKVLERLLTIPSSAIHGPADCTPLHAAVEAGRTDIIKQLLKGLPELANRNPKRSLPPLQIAVFHGNVEIVKILLEHDPNLAYMTNGKGHNAFTLAAYQNSVPTAEEIFSACPDSAFATHIEMGNNALHAAVLNEHVDFVHYILRTPKLHRLINQADSDGDLPLHIAAGSCNPELLRPLLFHERQDCTALNFRNFNAVDIVATATTDIFKTLKWNECYTLASSLIPVTWRNLKTEKTKKETEKEAIKEIKSLTARYTRNTSLVAALLATITFATAFTLPGGYSNDTSDAGLPIFAMKAAFQVFLISDTIAMCSSLAVAFLCVLATWEDLDFLLNYRKTTRALMWCAYVATVLAFGTGLFTVMAPKSLWIAILILVFCCIVPFLSKIIGDWPLLMLQFKLGRRFQKDLIPNI